MFKFGFGEAEEDTPGAINTQLDLVQPALCSIDDLKRRAPRISYSVDQYGLPRRDLYDVRFELMNLNEMSEEERILLSGDEDVRKNVYEGGLKIWEGTNDLLEVLSQPEFLNQEFKGGKVMELGCGAGIPSCYLLYNAIKASLPCKFVFSDYNFAVLQLLTMPNAVLAWLAATKHSSMDVENSEVVISVDLINEMLEDLATRNIEIEFVGGAWGERFTQLTQCDYDLVLASETIYSLDTIGDFTNVLCRALKAGSGKALVAAKRVYFGVGGGIVEFERLLSNRSVSYKTVLERGSVGRVVLEVKSNGPEY